MYDQNKGALIIFSGPSGSGKDTVLHELTKLDKNIIVSVSYTTRNPRLGETDGVDYIFITNEEFEQNIKDDKVLEFAKYGGNYYGTPKEPVDKWLSEGKNVILKIEVQGADKIRKLYPDVYSIFLMPPSIEILSERLHKRASDSVEDILKRISIAKEEMKRAKDYDYIVINNDLDNAVNQIFDLIKSENQ